MPWDCFCYGEDIDPDAIARAENNIDGDFIVNDCIGEPLYPPDSFDLVVCNPPFSTSWQPRELKHGTPPKARADWAFILHCLDCTTRRAIVIVAPGALYRTGREERIRRSLVEHNLVEAVIALPDNLFHGTTIATSILVLNKRKQKNDVLLIDASQAVDGKQGGKNLFSIKLAEKSPLIAVPAERLAECYYSLTPQRYIEPPPTPLGDINKINASVRRLNRATRRYTRKSDALTDWAESGFDPALKPDFKNGDWGD